MACNVYRWAIGTIVVVECSMAGGIGDIMSHTFQICANRTWRHILAPRLENCEVRYESISFSERLRNHWRCLGSIVIKSYQLRISIYCHGGPWSSRSDQFCRVAPISLWLWICYRCRWLTTVPMSRLETSPFFSISPFKKPRLFFG